MSYNYFNPQTVNNTAKIDGTIAGVNAALASTNGTAMAPTSVFNQGGYYVLQKDGSNYVEVAKLTEPNWMTGGTYIDQGLNQQPVSSNTQDSSANQTVNQNDQSIYINNPMPNYNHNEVQQPGYINIHTYPQMYQTLPIPKSISVMPTIDNFNPNTDNDTSVKSTQNDPVQTENTSDKKLLNATDLQKLVDDGVYDSLEEALVKSYEQGYEVSDEEQAKLGLFTDESEELIKTYMETYDVSRAEAVNALGDKVQTKEEVDAEYVSKMQTLLDGGFTEEEAAEILEKEGMEIPEELKDQVDLSKYTEEDQQKIAAYMETKGCSAKEAIEELGIKERWKGFFPTIGEGLGNFFGGIGKGVGDFFGSIGKFFFGE